VELYLLFIIICFIVAPFLPRSSDKVRRGVLILLLFLMVFLAFYNLSGVELHDYSVLPELEAMGLAPLAFTAHPYARMAVFGFLLVGALALLYGLQVAAPKEQAVSLVAIASAVGISFSANFITLFLFWEVLTFSVAILIMLKLTPYAVSMGRKFLIFHVAGGLLLFLGIVQHHSASGSFVLEKPAAGLLFFLLAIAFKAAFLPLHVWVAWGYPAASYATSVVLAGLTTKVGVYAVARILEPHPAIVLMGASMAVFGICCALLQKNMRGLLSYHIISQVGYMVAGAGMGGYYGIDGSLLHVINHMLYKALLFMSAGAVLLTAGTENLHDLSHHHSDKRLVPLWKVLPVAALGALIGSLAISGVPPFNGYVSKYLLKMAMYGAGPAETMLMLASAGTVVSFCKFCYFAFVKGRVPLQRGLPVSMQSAILLTSAACVFLGIYPQVVQKILPYHSSLTVYNAGGIVSALTFLAVGMAVFIVLKKTLDRGINLPAWLSVEFSLYDPLASSLQACCRYVTTFDSSLNNAYEKAGGTARLLIEKTEQFDGAINEAYEKSGGLARRLADRTEQFDGALNEAYERSGKLAKQLADGTQAFDASLNEAYESSGKLARCLADKAAQADDSLDALYEQSGQRSRSLWDRMRGRPSDWNIKNLNFDSFLIALMLGLFLFILVYVTGIR
jgi:multicomponent Na+:H+ antiporter subunit D